MINEDSELKHYKTKKKKKKKESYTEESFQYNELKHLKKKKKEKTEVPHLSQEFQSDKITNQNLLFSETSTLNTEGKFKHKHGKKHKKEKESILNEKETFDIVNETELPPQNRKKSKIYSHINEADTFNEVEVNVKNRKKHKKSKENSDIYEIANELGVISKKQKRKKCHVSHTEADDACYDYEINSNNHCSNTENGKKLYNAQTPAVSDEQILLEPLPKKHKKKRKHSDNTEACAVFDKHKEIYLNVTEGDNNYLKSEINSTEDHGKKKQENTLNVSEASAVVDRTQIFPKKHKKKKKQSDNTEVYPILNQQDFISNYSLSENNLNYEKSDLNLTETSTISQLIMSEKCKMIEKLNVDNLHVSNYNIGVELNDKMHAESSKNHLMTDCDESAINHTKHKKKHTKSKDCDESAINHKKHKKKHKKNKDCDESAINYQEHKKDKNYLNYGSKNDFTTLELTSNQYANNTVVDSTFNSVDANLSIKHLEKSKNKKKDKKNRENDLNQAYINKNLDNLKQNSADNIRNCTEIDISDILLNKEISHLPVVLRNNGNKNNYTANDTTFESFHSLSNSVYKHKQKNIENVALNTNEFNDGGDYYLIQQINNKTSDNTDYTDEHLQSNANKSTQRSAKFRNFTPCERIETTYFSTDIDCSEDPIDFEVPPLHKFETVHRLTEVQKNNLQESGVFIKTGKFTAAEDKIIQKNFEDFVKKFGVSDSFSLLGIGRYGKDAQLLKFLKAKHFYVRLAKDLNDRSLHSVYKRARVILHPFRNSGKLTEKDVEHLKRLNVTLSKKWQEIGDTLGSTAERCMETYRWHKKDIAKGKFTKEEETQLIEALKMVSGSSDISFKNMKDVNWDAVALHVPSRNSSQCRMYWANNLAWASGSAKKKWNKQCSSKLVHILKELNVDNSSKIDWYKIYKSFEDFAPSDLFVQKRWLYLRSQIPDYENKSFKKIIEMLCNKYPLS